MTQFQSNFKRVEKKYLLSEEQYEALMERLAGIAEIDEYGQTTILNIYYDTPDYSLIRESLDKPVYKEKLRLRTYGVPGDESPAFLEIKKKYQGIVYKRRISLGYRHAASCMAGHRLEAEPSQITGEIAYFLQLYEDLKPAMVISYDRIALKGIQDPGLRITFDTNIRWRKNDLDLEEGAYGRQILLPGQHLMEVKIAGALSLELARIFSELHIFPSTFSKYGKAYTMLRREETDRRIRKNQPAYSVQKRREAAYA